MTNPQGCVLTETLPAAQHEAWGTSNQEQAGGRRAESPGVNFQLSCWISPLNQLVLLLGHWLIDPKQWSKDGKWSPGQSRAAAFRELSAPTSVCSHTRLNPLSNQHWRREARPLQGRLFKTSLASESTVSHRIFPAVPREYHRVEAGPWGALVPLHLSLKHTPVNDTPVTHQWARTQLHCSSLKEYMRGQPVEKEGILWNRERNSLERLFPAY